MLTERPAAKYTYDEYLLIPEDGRRHELIDGDEHVDPAPTTRHQRIVMRLSYHFFEQVENTGQGEVFIAPVDVIFSEVDVVQPDVLFIGADRAEIVAAHGIVGAPSLVVEVLSEGNRRHDEVRKRKLYERYGVEEYWIIDPVLDTVKVYRMGEAGYTRVAEWSAEAGDTLTTPLLPGFALGTAVLFG